MKANKIFFDLYSTCGGAMPYDEYRKWYDANDTVYIVLVDAKIYTKVKRQVMFEMGLNNGCMIEHYPFRTPLEVENHAMGFIQNLKAKYFPPKEFQEIEAKCESERVKKAFAYAEQLIAND